MSLKNFIGVGQNRLKFRGKKNFKLMNLGKINKFSRNSEEKFKIDFLKYTELNDIH